MDNGVYTMIRMDQDGMDINVYIDMYELPAELMKEGTETNVIEVFRKIAKDYLATAEGKRELEYNCGYFNWNDFANIPEKFLNRYGIRSVPIVSRFYTEVDANEELV